MFGTSVDPRTLQRLQALAAQRGQSLNDWFDDLIAATERQSGTAPPGTGGASPLIDLACEHLGSLCGNDSDLRRVSGALRAAAIDGEHSHVGPLGRDGLTLELSPQWEGVRIIVGEGRFTLTDAAALRLADRLVTGCWRPVLAA
jgi:hypothetical protein